MRKLIYMISAVLLTVAVFLTVYSPDTLSIIILVIMMVIVAAGLIFGIFPLASICAGLSRGINNIDKLLYVESDSMWSSISGIDNLFLQKFLDMSFAKYKERISNQSSNGQLLSDVEEYINEDSIGIKCWNGVILQIPGTLTGLGILGTFVGLIIGISEIGFSSVDAALTSVQTLLNGIHIAFYTSIAGVILSILFNVLHKITWNITMRQEAVFLDEFHKNVIPTVEEQNLYREEKHRQQVLDRLERIPKNPGFSISNIGMGSQNQVMAQHNEKILMPQIIEGLRNKEFVFVLQPKYDINTRKIVAAEAFTRWHHEKLGTVSPAVFLPILEENGYITKLDEYVWNSVCGTVREWIDNGIRTVPISLNISKTDILASDVIGFFDKMMETYKVPPRLFEIEIARNAFIEAQEITVETASLLRQKGFKIIIDGFDGNFIPFNAIEKLPVDEAKFDIRRLDMKVDTSYIKSVFAQSQALPYNVTVEGIETMEQVTLLRKCGCVTGQGFYFSKPVSQEEFVNMV